MQWDKGTETTMNGWLGMQEKLLKGWWDVLTPPPQNGHASSAANTSWERWLTQGLEPWQAFYQGNVATAQQMMAEVTKQAMTQFLSGQDQTQQLMRLVSEAWQAMLVKGTSPADWQTALFTYTEQLRQQLNATLNSGQLLENSAELWRLYHDEAQKFAQPWLSAWWQMPTFMSKVGGGERAEATNAFMQLFQAAFEQTWGRALLSPSIGLTREFNEKVSKGFDLWLENQQALSTYQLLVSEAWVDAFQALMQKLVAMAQKGETITDQRHLLRIWVEVADEVFIELFHSAPYAKAQSAYVNSNMALRQQQRDLLEVWLRSNDMPTRTDLDEAHHQLYQLRKEVKALKKTLAAPEQKPASVAPAAPKHSPASATAKKRVGAARKQTPKQGADAVTDQSAANNDSDAPTPAQPAPEGEA